MADSQLFEDTFTLTSINSQKYDRVSRLSGNSENQETYFTLDVNTELYPCAVGDRLHLLLASTLSLDGTKDDQKGWRDVGRGEASLADMYDYVCHGKIYRFEEGEGENMYVMAIFFWGGVTGVPIARAPKCLLTELIWD
ncbi:DNA-directed RNA polymerases I, II, and III subunit RPABC3 [Lignoscripta atroalba]|nr:DNA-directed RNA polymerases I, II, and III subunit RPABC3 [Lignoscripta atroalba]